MFKDQYMKPLRGLSSDMTLAFYLILYCALAFLGNFIVLMKMVSNEVKTVSSVALFMCLSSYLLYVRDFNIMLVSGMFLFGSSAVGVVYNILIKQFPKYLENYLCDTKDNKEFMIYPVYFPFIGTLNVAALLFAFKIMENRFSLN